MRRITRSEFDHAIEDLLGDTSQPGRSLSTDEATGHFAANVTAPVTLLGVEQYIVATDQVVRNALARIDQVVPCSRTRADEACARDFARELANRAYGQPVDAESLDELMLVYRADPGIEPAPTFAERIGLLIQAVLLSPDFLYRPELGNSTGDGPELVRLSDFELARRLSFLLWESIPDDALVKAAQSGELASATGLGEQARRMIRDAKFMRAVQSFHTQWLEISSVASITKDASRFPEFSKELAASMSEETRRFIQHVFEQPQATLDVLLGASFTFADARLATHYGVQYPTGSQGFVRIELPSVQRSGLLTHASVLATHAHADQSSPVQRGVFVLDRVLCQPLAPPPPTVDVTPPDPAPDATTRERFAEHTANPACAGCHAFIDPIGFGFEAYDAIGHFHVSENNLPVDASGALLGSDVDGPFDGAMQLIERLRSSAQVERCMARLWVEYAFARVPSSDDSCTLAHAERGLAASGGDVRALLLSIAEADAFRYARRR
jgi:hypothetical protein